MKKYLKFACFALIVGVILPFNACKDDDEPENQLRPDCDIVEFTIPSLSLVGAIDATAKTVTFTVAPDYDDELLKDVAPTIKISASATISPDAAVKQDFSKDVKYTVTAENGDVKEWTVKLVRSPYTLGIGQTQQLWLKTAEDLGLGKNIEPTMATFGDKVIASRSGLIFDAKTGTSAGVLNTEGIVLSTTPGEEYKNVAFTLTNDDAGNLIGCVLGAWSTPDFKVYKWTALDAAPVEIISYTKSGTSFGRKLIAVGDVNGAGYVISYDVNSAASSAQHYCWKFTGGNVESEPQIVAPASQANTNTGDIQQMLLPVSSNSLTSYYISDRGQFQAAPPTFLKYFTPTGAAEGTTIKGPLTTETGDVSEINQGWGRKILHSMLFYFNGKQYIASLTYADFVSSNEINYHYFVYDIENMTKPVFHEKVTYSGVFGDINFNGTAGLAIGKEEVNGEERKIYLYGLMTSSGIVCYELTNLAKTQ